MANFEIYTGVQAMPLRVVVYGPEGIGKSTFAAYAPDPLFIDTEGSTLRLNVKRLPPPTSLAMLLEEINFVAHSNVCSTLVLDTADWAEKLCREHVCSKYQKGGIEDFGYGKGFSYVFEEMGKILNALDDVVRSGVHVILTAHAAMRKFEQPDEMGSYDRWELKLINSPKCNVANMVKEWSDLCLFANYETIVVKSSENKSKAQGGKRVMYTSHHPCWDAKNRFGLPEKLPFDFNQVAWCFQAFACASSQIAPALQPIPAQQSVPDSAPVLTAEPTPAHTEPIHTATETNASEDTPNHNLPRPLLDLMSQNNVTESDIQNVVAARGYYPASTPVQNYDPDFINGVLIGAWQQVLTMIKESK